MTPDHPGPGHRPPEPLYTTGPLRWRAPVRRHRPPVGRVAPVLGALATLALVVVLGGVVTGGELSADERFREFVTTGELGEPVPARTFEVTVLAVRAAATVTTGPATGHETGGVWVLVRVRVLADQRPRWVRYAAVRDSGGRTWLATERISQPLVDGSYRLEPGIPVEGEIAFEVPREAATDLTVRLGPAFPSDLRMDAVAEVRLPIDEQLVTDALAGKEPVVVEAPEIVIADPQILVGTGEAGE